MMAITGSGDYDEPEFASTGNSPDFAADLTAVSAFFGPRVLRRFDTVTDMNASAGHSANDWATADDAPGDLYFWNGSVWVNVTSDTGWLALTPASGYTGATLLYRVKNNVTYLRGQLTKNSGNVINGDTLFTLPAGARHSSSASLVVEGAGAGAATVRLSIAPAGVVTVSSTPSATTAYVFIDGICFPVD